MNVEIGRKMLRELLIFFWVWRIVDKEMGRVIVVLMGVGGGVGVVFLVDFLIGVGFVVVILMLFKFRWDCFLNWDLILVGMLVLILLR